MIRKGIHFSSQNWKIVSLISVGSWILILLRPGVCQPRLRTWWEKQIFQRDFQKFTALMPLLVSSEHICCAWHGQSKYFYSSVVLENDVYSNPGDGCQPRLNTVFLIVFFFFTVSRLCGFCSVFASAGEFVYVTFWCFLALINDLPPPWNCLALNCISLNLCYICAEAQRQFRAKVSFTTKLGTYQIKRVKQVDLSWLLYLTIYLLRTIFPVELCLRLYSRFKDTKKKSVFSSRH